MAQEKKGVLEAALEYLRMGWVPIPLKLKAKTPLISWRKWQQRKPTAADLKSWWERWPDANVAILTGATSGIMALDLEAGTSLDSKPIPPTPMQETGGGGRHYLFRHPGFPVPNAVKILPGVDLRGDGGYIVVPPSVHPSGKRYEWVITPEQEPLAEAPAWLLELIKQHAKPKSAQEWKQIAQGVPEGQRNETAASYIGKLLAHLPPELWETACWDAAKAWNTRNQPPISETELRSVFESITSREVSKRAPSPAIQPTTQHPDATWSEVEAAFKRWLELPDLDAVRVVLATFIANRMPGDPVWLFLVAPPSSAKTEIILSLADLPDAYTLSTLTPHTFLSGKEPKDNKGDISLLPQLTNKVLVMKDFAPILDLHRDARQAIFSQLRDIYDGKHDRAVGSEKRTMRWEGKVGFIAGITQTLDQFSGFLSLLGERFLQFRLPPTDESKTFRRALQNVGKEKGMRAELRRVVAGFLQTLSIPKPEEFSIPDPILEKLEALVRLVIRARTGVIRDWYGHKEIIYVPDHEGPARLTKQLAMLMMGLATLRGSKEITLEEYRLGYKTGLDSIHKLRRSALELLAQEDEWRTSEFAIHFGLSTPSAKRILEDLAAVGITAREKTDDYDTAPDSWQIAPEIRKLWEAAKP